MHEGGDGLQVRYEECCGKTTEEPGEDWLVDQIEARFEKAASRIGALTPSLLARAFRGELGPQDPADEPAETLLSRIGDGKQIAGGRKSCRNGLCRPK